MGLWAIILAVAGLVGAGGPAAGRRVRVELAQEAALAPGLEELAGAVRAELVAAGFALAAPRDSTGGDQSDPAAAVARLRPFGEGAALVEVSATGFAWSFSAEVALDGQPGGRRTIDEAALLVTEWLTAIALPAPSPAAPPAAGSPRRSVVGDAEIPVSARVRSPGRAGPRGEPDASLDWGFGMWRPWGLPSRSGPQLGLTLFDRGSRRGGTTLFLRTSVGLYWMGPRMADTTSGPMDVIYGNAGVSAGLHQQLSRRWSLELQTGVGLALVWLQIGYASSGPFPSYAFNNDRHWLAAAGGGVQVAYRLSWRWALALDAGGFWMFPGVVRDALTIARETVSLPALSTAFALRMAL